ncbi:gamma-glutamyltransferase [Litorimonas sp. WD9-15]|uniref:gamma-glutamyltransferase n=1 Tax=Litorimonas sp. WD9-15 TaxID=3418716 RepID=UPI003CFC4A92
MKHLLLASTIFLAACVATETAPSTDLKSASAVMISTTPTPKTGMVAAANPYATEAGLEILRAGGSAVDAAIAVQATLGLVEPQSSGLGGGAFMVIYDPKTAKVWSYDGRETAPAGADPTMFLDPETGKPLGYFNRVGSGMSTGVPGAVVMLHRAHQDYGVMDWGTQFDGSIELAEEGFVVSPRMAGLVKRLAPYILRDDANANAYFFPDDAPIPEGYVRNNPEYAQTLKAIAENPRALLEGEIAEDIIKSIRMEPRPGTLTLADMAAYEPKKSEALCTDYRGHAICGAQPPASGGVAVQSILGMLENFDMAEAGNSALGWHLFAEASFLGYADRDEFVADPAFVEVPVAEMLDEDYLKSRAELIKVDTVNTNVTAGDPVGFKPGKDATPDSPGTSHFTVVDKNGLTISMTTTVESAFGSQRMVRGFMLNNELTDFSSYAVDEDGVAIANAVAAGKRPRSSMSPHIVFAPDGEFLFTTGSPGGNSIIAYTAKTIVGMVDWGLSPQEAIELPNVIARNGSLRLEAKNLKDAETDELDRGAGAVEFGMEEDIVSALEEMGHTVRRSKGEISGLHIIYRQEDGTLIGGADPRREGTAEAQ